MSQQTLSQQNCGKSFLGHKDLRFTPACSTKCVENGKNMKGGKLHRSHVKHVKGEEWERGRVIHAAYTPHHPKNRQLCYSYVDLAEAFSPELFDVPAATSLFKPVRSVIACISHIKTPCITCMTQIWHTPQGISARLDPNTFSCLASRLFAAVWIIQEMIVVRKRGNN